jgi:hypothetical protein
VFVVAVGGPAVFHDERRAPVTIAKERRLRQGLPPALALSEARKRDQAQNCHQLTVSSSSCILI